MIAMSNKAEARETARTIEDLVAVRWDLIHRLEQQIAETGRVAADLVAELDQVNRKLRATLNRVAGHWGLTWDELIKGDRLRVTKGRPDHMAMADEWDAIQARKGLDRRAVRA